MSEIDTGDIAALGDLLRAIRSLADGSVNVTLDELLCQILDDGRLAEFAGPLGAQYGLSDVTIANLRALHDAIGAYEHSLCSFSDRPTQAGGPLWESVREAALAVGPALAGYV